MITTITTGTIEGHRLPEYRGNAVGEALSKLEGDVG